MCIRDSSISAGSSLAPPLPTGETGRGASDDPAEILVTELTTPQYTFTSTGKIAVESKDAMKRRGFASPDVADALVLTFAENLSLLTYGSAAGTSWGEPITRGLSVV